MANRRTFLVWVVVASGAVFLVIALRRMEWGMFFASLAGVYMPKAAIAALLIAGSAAGRALRWSIIAGRPLTYWHFWSAAALGYLGNMVYPARAGEAIRMTALCRFARVPPGEAVATAVVDRICDGILTAGLLLIAVWGAGAAELAWPSALFAAAFGGAAGVLWLVSLGGARAKRWIGIWSVRLPAKIGDRIKKWSGQAVDGIVSLRQAGRMIPAAMLTVLVFIADVGEVWLMFGAFGWNLPLSAAVTLQLFLLAGTSLPGAPAFVGVYQAACVLALRLFGVAEAAALAFSAVLHILMFGVLVIQGVLVLGARGTGNLRSFRLESW